MYWRLHCVGNGVSISSAVRVRQDGPVGISDQGKGTEWISQEPVRSIADPVILPLAIWLKIAGLPVNTSSQVERIRGNTWVSVSE